jgi:hypothetical protein
VSGAAFAEADVIVTHPTTWNSLRRQKNSMGASGLIAAGCDVVTVQRALGHSSAAITLTTYSHLWPDANDRTRKAAAGLFAEAIGSTADALRTEGRN